MRKQACQRYYFWAASLANESQKPRPAVTFTHLHQPSVPSTNVWAFLG